MSVDDRDKTAGEPSSSRTNEEIREALQSDTDEPLPPAAEAVAELDAQSPHPRTPQGRRRRFLNRRNLIIATTAAVIGGTVPCVAVARAISESGVSCRDLDFIVFRSLVIRTRFCAAAQARTAGSGVPSGKTS